MFEVNEYQKKAIEQLGNVVLSAGAGSGKTFVIVENLINYIATHYINNGKERNLSSLRQGLSEIAIITFTIKASEELKFRISKRIEGILSENDQWKDIWENLDCIYIGTIHGLCLKTLRNLYLDFKQESILSEASYIKKIEKLLSVYLNANPNILEYFKYEHLLEAIVRLFSDTDRRLNWNSKQELLTEEDLIENLIEKFNLNKLDEVLNHCSGPGEKKWYIYLTELNSLLKDSTSVNSLNTFFNSFKGVRKTKEFADYPDLMKIWEYQANFKKIIKEIALYKLTPELEQNIYDELNNCLQFVEKYYRKEPGLIFSDLEFYLYKNLKKNKQELKSIYSYIIVDEFQDTSLIQFDIIKLLVSNKFEKLFCVGDLKQSIYGFRGGSVNSFLKAREQFEFKLNLIDNYRSSKKIVNFVNQLFSNLYTAKMYESQVGVKEIEASNVRLIHIEAQSDQKINKFNDELIEAYGIYQDIKSLTSSESVAVLYKTLFPSLKLAGILKENNFSFKLQLKSELLENEVLNILFEWLKYIDDPSVGNLSTLVNLIKESEAFGTKEKDTQEILTHSILVHNTHGVILALDNIVYAMGLYDENYLWLINLLKELLKYCQGEIKQCVHLINKIKSKKASDWLYIGPGPYNISLMTVHSSKGLEYDHVMVAGIAHNSIYKVGNEILGKENGSFVVNRFSDKKRSFKSFLEKIDEIERQKNEEKRLFYVAVTRAINSIYFYHVKTKKKNNSSWLNYIEENILDLSGLIDMEERTIDLTSKTQNLIFKQSKVIETQYNEGLVYYPNLSATGLSIIDECPKKYYFSQMMKIDEKNLETLFDLGFKPEVIKPAEDKKSSKGRGLKLHKKISDYINGVSFDKEEIDQIISDLDKNYANYDLESEVEIKFRIFSQMISATPDLVLIPSSKDLVTEIWDFKTGGRNKILDSKYFTQLTIYAYGLYELEKIDKNEQVLLKLYYIDQEINMERVISFDQTQDKIAKLWMKLKNIKHKNLDSCFDCSYLKICH